MMAEDQTYCALFDYDSFLIRLLPTKINFGNNHAEIDKLQIYDLISTHVWSKKGLDSFSSTSVDKLPKFAKDILVHETFHWWQALSSSFFISRFLLSLKLIKQNAEEKGLDTKFFSDTFPMADNKSTLLEHYKSSLSNFLDYSVKEDEINQLTTVFLAIEKDFGIIDRSQQIKKFKQMGYGEGMGVYNKLYGENHSTFNIISDDPPTAMPFFEFPHLLEGQKLPGYTAILDYFYYLYFSGGKIIESATYISELLYHKKDIPTIDLSNIKEHEYLGVWEFYKRLHGKRYESAEALALSFLALVDLTFINNTFIEDDEAYNIEEKYENSSLSYRFGKIVFRAQGVPPLDISSGNYEQAVKDYQDSFCSYTGMPNPESGIKGMLIHLIGILLRDLQYFFNKEEADKIRLLITPLIDNHNDSWKNFLEVVRFLNIARERLEGKAKLGHDVAGVMLNALYYRLSNRGKFVLPQLYYNELRSTLPLPLVIFDGNYYQDHNIANISSPYRIDNYQLNHDFIILKTLSPMIEGDFNCGFRNNVIKCFYMKLGAGCPYKELSKEESELRNRHKLGNWCHWSYTITNLFRQKLD